MENKKIKIAILAPMFLSIPPKKQGGTEWVVYHQANGLVQRGYDVSLFAVAGSQTKAHLIPIAQKGAAEYEIVLNKMESSRKLRLEMTFIARVVSKLSQRRGEFDIIFNHTRGGEILVPLAEYFKAPVVNVLHLPIFKELGDLFREYNAPLVSISNNQREAVPDLNYIETVYNGVDTAKFSFNPDPKDYLLTITTIGEHKNTLASLMAAKETNQKLIIAGKVRDQKYFQEKIEPLIDGQQIIYLGEIGFKEKIELYQNAKAFLFPSIWPEPFGLVMIEAMACGTPVIGFNNASIPEVVENGKTGFVVECSTQGLIKGIQQIDSIKRQNCRKRVEEKFSLEKMMDDYEKVLQKIVKRNS